MPKYKLLNDVYLDDEVKQAGTVVDLPADKAADFVERGSIIEHDENAVEETVEVPDLKGEVTDQFTLGDNEYKQLLTAEGLTVYSMDGVEVSENAFVSAKQRLVQEDLDQKRLEAEQEVETSAEAPLPATEQAGQSESQSTQEVNPPSNTEEQHQLSETTSPNLHLG